MKKHSSAISLFLQKEIDPAFARRARIVLSHIDVKPGMKILDVGCGRGFYELAISTIFPGVDVVGVDLNAQYLSVARQAVNDKNITFLKADGTKLPFANSSFDRVVCSEVLEHVLEDTKVIKEIYRVLKRDGRAIVTVPNKYYPFFWDPLNFFLERVFNAHIPANIWWLAGIWADHVRLYSEDELVKKIRFVGFSFEYLWRSTAYCLPFSHFILYGVGKNLVEKGLVGKQFNRFDKASSSKAGALFQWFFSLFDSYNRDDVSYKRFVNLVLVVKKG